jgi:mucin-2
VASPLDRIAKELKARPLLFAGGGALLLVGATIVSRNQADMGDQGDQGADDAATDDSGELSAADGGTLGFGSSYTYPSYSGTDPLTADLSGDTVTTTTTTTGTTSSGSTSSGSTSSGSTSTKATGPRITIPKGRSFNYYRRDSHTGKYVSVGRRTAGSAVTWKTGQPVTGRTAGGSSITLVRLTSGPLSGYYVGRGIGAWQQ